jgi:two-component system, cell cycle sensor histidine kinase PleC
MSTEALGPLGSGTYKSYAQNIGSSGGELLHLLQSVLTLSEAESGKHEADIHPLNLHQALTRALHLLHENAANSDTNVAFTATDRKDVLVMSDERTLKQILLHSFQIVQAGPGNKVTATLEENRPDETAVLTISSSAQWHPDDLPPELKDSDDSAGTGIPGESSSPTALRIAMIRSMATVVGSTVNVDKTSEVNGRRVTVLLPLAPEGTVMLDSQRPVKSGADSSQENLRHTG